MEFLCKENNCSFLCSNKDEFIKHVKDDHKIKIDQYLKWNLKKRDFLTKELIDFKSFEQYLLTDFVNKKNMLAWLKIEKDKLAKKFLLNKIKDHSKLKSVCFFPSSSEMRTISYLPSIKTYEFFFPDLDNFIKLTGLKSRYSYNKNELKFNFIYQKSITVDTREQKPIKLKDYQIINEKLDFGDYSCDRLLAIERKSLNDLVSTLSSGFDRFNREVARAKEANGYIVVVTECDINKFLSFSYSRTGRFAKASTDFVFHRFREVCKNFPENIQFCFSGGRKESSELIPKILALDVAQAKTFDFQYLIEHNLI
jgi:hypothetical protein